MNWQFMQRRGCSTVSRELFPEWLTITTLTLDVLLGHAISMYAVLMVLRLLLRKLRDAFFAFLGQYRLWGSWTALQYVHAPLVADLGHVYAFVSVMRDLAVFQPPMRDDVAWWWDMAMVLVLVMCTVVLGRTAYMSLVVYKALN